MPNQVSLTSLVSIILWRSFNGTCSMERRKLYFFKTASVCCSLEQIAQKGNSLDLGLIRDESILDYEDLPDPIESAEDAISQLEMAVDLIKDVVKELKKTEENIGYNR